LPLARHDLVARVLPWQLETPHTLRSTSDPAFSRFLPIDNIETGAKFRFRQIVVLKVPLYERGKWITRNPLRKRILGHNLKANLGTSRAVMVIKSIKCAVGKLKSRGDSLVESIGYIRNNSLWWNQWALSGIKRSVFNTGTTQFRTLGAKQIFHKRRWNMPLSRNRRAPFLLYNRVQSHICNSYT
jgi:hypothetical protein